MATFKGTQKQKERALMLGMQKLVNKELGSNSNLYLVNS
jgi:hypothetical protein